MIYTCSSREVEVYVTKDRMFLDMLCIQRLLCVLTSSICSFSFGICVHSTLYTSICIETQRKIYSSIIVSSFTITLAGEISTLSQSFSLSPSPTAFIRSLASKRSSPFLVTQNPQNSFIFIPK